MKWDKEKEEEWHHQMLFLFQLFIIKK